MLFSDLSGLIKSGDPARYVGIDANHNIIARNLVLREMMMDPKASNKSILQV